MTRGLKLENIVTQRIKSIEKRNVVLDFRLKRI